MGPVVPKWVEQFHKKLSSVYEGREFMATLDYETGSWRFVERDVKDANGIHVYAGDIERNGFANELKRVLDFFKPEEKE